jgi:4-nitrophenyl phosphatase
LTAHTLQPDILRSVRSFIVDMDGVLYRGQEPLPGAREFLNHLQEEDVPFILATNNSTLTPPQYVAKLGSMGMAVPADRILTSAQATAIYLSKVASPAARVYVVGEDGLLSAVRDQGLVIADTRVDFVVVGLDRQLTYEKLKIATLAIRAGARFIGTNPDKTLPTEEGLQPGSGAILAALEAATGVEPVIIGKPHPILLRLATERLGSTADSTALVGDRLETDIVGGREAGLITVLVLTGISQKDDLQSSAVRPDLVVSKVGDLHQLWRRYREI